MFEAGAIEFRLQMVGEEVFQRSSDNAERSVSRLGATTKTTASNIELSGKKAREAAAANRQFSADTERALNTVGRAMIGAGLAVAAMVALSVVKFAEYDTALSGLQATTKSGVEELAELGDAALDTGRKFGYSAAEAISGEEALAKAGVGTAEILSGALTGSLTLAAAGQLGVADSAEIAAIAMVQFKKEGKDVPHIADLIAAGAGKAVGDVDDLAMALKQGGLVSSQFGVSLEETVGTLSAFAAAGLIGSDAGTSYKTMLLSLAAPQGKAASLMKELNIEAYDQQGKFIGIAALAGVLKDRLGTLSAEQRQAALSTIFGTDAIRAASVLYEEGADGIRQWTEDVNDSGYAARQAADRLDNLQGDIGKLSAAVDRGLIKSGSAANDVLREMVQALTELADWYGDLPPEAQGAALAIGVGTAAVLLFSGTILVTIPRIAAFKMALTELNLSMGKTAVAGGAVGIALTALTIILGAIAGANADARAKTAAYGDTLESTTNKATKATRELVKENLSAAGSFGDWLDGFSGSAYDAAESLGLSLDVVTEAALGNADALEEVKRATETLDAVANHSLESKYLIKKVKGENESIEEAIRIAKQKQVADANAETANEDLADSYAEVEDSIDGVITSLQDLAKELDAANGKHLDAREAARQLEAAYDELDAAVKKNGKTLDITTEAGRENQAALDAIARAAMDSGQAIIDAGGSYEDYRASLESSRAALLERIADFGITGDAAQTLADTILSIPTESQWTAVAETTAATEKLLAYQSLLNGIIASGNTVGIPVPSKPSSSDPFKIDKADGGKVVFYANGGYENHQAEVARAGTIRVWNEPETGGEYYIPASPAKRPRSTAVLAQAADDFGYQLVPKDAQSFAEGGRAGSAAPSSGSGGREITGTLEIINGRAYIKGILNDELGDNF